MACVEHVCCNIKCNTFVFNNESTTPSRCPKCGADMSHFWDEETDHMRDKEEGDDE